MRNLQAAADAAGQTVAEFCADVVGTDPDPGDGDHGGGVARPARREQEDPAPGPHNNAPPGQTRRRNPRAADEVNSGNYRLGHLCIR